MLFEQSFLLDPTHDEALLNYGRTLRLLQPDEQEVSQRTLRLVSDANRPLRTEESEKESRKRSIYKSALVQRAGGGAIGGLATPDKEPVSKDHGRTACQ